MCKVKIIFLLSFPVLGGFLNSSQKRQEADLSNCNPL